MNQLRDLRKRKGLSLEELADAIGVHKMTLVRYQTGTRYPRLPVRKLLCLELDVGEAELERALKEETDADRPSVA